MGDRKDGVIRARRPLLACHQHIMLPISLRTKGLTH